MTDVIPCFILSATSLVVRRSSSTTFLMSGAVCARPTDANEETVKTAMRARACFIDPPLEGLIIHSGRALRGMRTYEAFDVAILAPMADADREKPGGRDGQDDAGGACQRRADPDGEDHRGRRQAHPAADQARVHDVVLHEPEDQKEEQRAPDEVAGLRRHD